ncbi:MAG: RNA-binding protein [Pseudomonadota bacterium]|nr:RNA-binding protein [Pseudomonadota bacterium]
MDREQAAATEETGDTMRLCALTRVQRISTDLLRFCAGPDGVVVPDLKGRLPGRGVWLTCAADVVGDAAGRNVFARSLRQPVRTPQDLPALVDRLLLQDAVQRLSLANKAGEVTSGFTGVEKAIAGGKVVSLLHATEAAADGRRKLDGKFAGKGGGPVLDSLNSAQLGLALGRTNVLHAAVTSGGAGARLLAALRRLDRFRAGSAVFAAA